MDSATAEVMQRLYQSKIRCIFDVVDRLYWDVLQKRPKFGIPSQKATGGDLRHRLPVRIVHLEKTYDLMSLIANQLLELLGEEFSFGRRKTAKLFGDAVH